MKKDFSFVVEFKDKIIFKIKRMLPPGKIRYFYSVPGNPEKFNPIIMIARGNKYNR